LNGFAASKPASLRSGIYKPFVDMKKVDDKKKDIPWGSKWQAPTTTNSIAQTTWKDNALVLFMSTNTIDPEEVVIRERKRPKKTSAAAKVTRPVFGNNPTKELPIPKFIDDYNHLMNGVDRADQLRSGNSQRRRIRRGGWHALWGFLFDVVLVNSFLLSGFKKQSDFWQDLINSLFQKSERLHSEHRKGLVGKCASQKVGSGHTQKECVVCKAVYTTLSSRAVLREISSNLQGSRGRKRKRTSYACVDCDLPVFKEGNCLRKHCKTA
jgi:hypothetical protein